MNSSDFRSAKMNNYNLDRRTDMKNNITENVENETQENAKYMANSVNDTFKKLQSFDEVSHLVAQIELGAWDRIIELETDDWVSDEYLWSLRRAVDDVTKAVIDKERYGDAIILPLISADLTNHHFKMLVLIKFDGDEDGECVFMKAYRKFYTSNDGYFYKNSSSIGVRKLSSLEVQEKINEFELNGRTHYLGSKASLPHESFSSLFSNQALMCSADLLQ
jgi:hypothetical protein